MENHAELLEQAKDLITEFCDNEYGDNGPIDFSNLTKIPIAHTTVNDNDLPVQAYVNLEAFCIDFYLGDILAARRQYSSLGLLVEHELENLDFSDLTYFPEEQIADVERRLNANAAKERVARNELPASCFSTLPGTGELVVLKRGIKGYFKCEESYDDRSMNQVIADFHNKIDSISPAQLLAMEIGSLSGFDVPGANPQMYLNSAKYLCAFEITGSIKDTVMSITYPVKGKLLQYSVAGREVYYLEPQSVPNGLMGVRNDIIINADMVSGRPLVPVKKPVWSPHGVCNLELEDGSYTRGMEICEDYRVLAKTRVGSAEYVFGEMPTHDGFFVTWERSPNNDGNGAPRYYCGNYFEARQNALRDFSKRASEQYKALSGRKPSIRAQLAEFKPEQRDTHNAKTKNREEAR